MKIDFCIMKLATIWAIQTIMETKMTRYYYDKTKKTHVDMPMSFMERVGMAYENWKNLVIIKE